MKYNQLFENKYIDKIKQTDHQQIGVKQFKSHLPKSTKEKNARSRENIRVINPSVSQNLKGRAKGDKQFQSVEKISKPLLNAQNADAEKRQKLDQQDNSFQFNNKNHLNPRNQRNPYASAQMYKIKQKMQQRQKHYRQLSKQKSLQRNDKSIQKTQIYAPYPTQAQSQKMQSLKTKRVGNSANKKERTVSLQQIKAYVRKILEQIKFEQQKISQIIEISNCQRMFQRLSDALKRMLEGYQKIEVVQPIQVKNRQDSKLINQCQMLTKSQNKLKQKVQQLLNIRKQDIQKIKILQQQIEEKQTQIFRSKQLIEQTETNLLKISYRNRKLEKKIMKKSLQCENKVQQKIRQLEQMDITHKRLRLIVEQQTRNNQEKQVKNSILLMQLNKWQRQCVRLRQRYFAEVEVSNEVMKQRRQESQNTISKQASFAKLFGETNHQICKENTIQQQIKSAYESYIQIIDNLSYKLLEEQEKSEQIHIDFLKQKQKNRALFEQNRMLKNQIEQLQITLQFEKRKCLDDNSFKINQTAMLKQQLAAVKLQLQSYRDAYMKNHIDNYLYLQFQHGNSSSRRTALNFDLQQAQHSISDSFKSFT